MRNKKQEEIPEDNKSYKNKSLKRTLIDMCEKFNEVK